MMRRAGGRGFGADYDARMWIWGRCGRGGRMSISANLITSVILGESAKRLYRSMRGGTTPKTRQAARQLFLVKQLCSLAMFSVNSIRMAPELSGAGIVNTKVYEASWETAKSMGRPGSFCDSEGIISRRLCSKPKNLFKQRIGRPLPSLRTGRAQPVTFSS